MSANQEQATLFRIGTGDGSFTAIGKFDKKGWRLYGLVEINMLAFPSYKPDPMRTIQNFPEVLPIAPEMSVVSRASEILYDMGDVGSHTDELASSLEDVYAELKSAKLRRMHASSRRKEAIAEIEHLLEGLAGIDGLDEIATAAVDAALSEAKED